MIKWSRESARYVSEYRLNVNTFLLVDQSLVLNPANEQDGLGNECLWFQCRMPHTTNVCAWLKSAGVMHDQLHRAMVGCIICCPGPCSDNGWCSSLATRGKDEHRAGLCWFCDVLACFASRGRVHRAPTKAGEEPCNNCISVRGTTFAFRIRTLHFCGRTDSLLLIPSCKTWQIHSQADN